MTAALEGVGEYELLFVNDGSRDATLRLLKEIHAEDPRAKILSFSANRGHQIAVTAGLDVAQGDYICIIDADLQDPPELIPAMLEKINEGFDVVYGKRKSRDGDSAFKKATAWGFYRLLNKLTSTDIPADTGDFRMITRRAADAVRAMREHNRFLRGMFAWIGFRQTAIEFERDKRFAGETKYPLKQMLKLAGNGIYSFSLKPIGWIWKAGAAICAVSLAWLFVLLIMLIAGIRSGIQAGIALNLLTDGIVLAAIGVVGVYIGRIYQEAQGRPLYYFDELIGIKTGNTTHNDS
jgi:dolichol-phosphate mannosyltransferase